MKKKKRRKGRLRGTHVSTKMKTEMKFRSGWEKVYFEYLDNDSQVVAFYSESLRIPYVSNKRTGKVRNYIPDLLVEYADRKVLIEIKPAKRIKQATNVKKFAAAREYCKINDLEFIIITENELKSLGLL